jgi:hypothetical protein
MRLKSEIWVHAYLRRVFVAGGAAYVARRGDADAGAIMVTVLSDAGVSLLAPALSAGAEDGERCWTERVAAAEGSHEKVRTLLARETSIDPDIWVIDVEDRAGRHFLDDSIVDD